MANRYLIGGVVAVVLIVSLVLVLSQWGRGRPLAFETIYRTGPEGDHVYLVTDNSEISVFMGTQPTAGYDISIEQIVDMGDEIVVYVKENYPGREVVLTAITSPGHVVRIEQVQKPIVFEVKQFKVHLCDEIGLEYNWPVLEFVAEYRVEPGSGPPEPD